MGSIVIQERELLQQQIAAEINLDDPGSFQLLAVKPNTKTIPTPLHLNKRL